MLNHKNNNFYSFKQATPMTTKLHIRTKRQVPKLGVMLVGWGGNNGSTVTAALLANKLQLGWETKEGMQKANW
jgi:myo-inositol-1-phosphate synthase